MKKIMLFTLLLSGCSAKVPTSLYYNEQQTNQLKEYGIYEYAEQECINKDTLLYALDHEFQIEHLEAYCALAVSKPQYINALLDDNVPIEDIQTYLNIDYFDISYLERYLAFDQPTILERVRQVNLHADLVPYSSTTIIEDDLDLTMLINKYYSLPTGYLPNDLVEIDYPCVQGVDYSCTLMEKQELRSVAAQALKALGDAAQAQGLQLVTIASYRSYEYQNMLYQSGIARGGQEYADLYYARPGQSEHNSGLAVDLSFSGYPYNQIETHPQYEWLLQNAPTYGFILRYPQDRTDITKYGYESWHFRYVGPELAMLLHQQDLTLEEYYAYKERN